MVVVRVANRREFVSQLGFVQEILDQFFGFFGQPQDQNVLAERRGLQENIIDLPPQREEYGQNQDVEKEVGFGGNAEIGDEVKEDGGESRAGQKRPRKARVKLDVVGRQMQTVEIVYVKNDEPDGVDDSESPEVPAPNIAAEFSAVAQK